MVRAAMNTIPLEKTGPIYSRNFIQCSNLVELITTQDWNTWNSKPTNNSNRLQI